jgi:DNA-binding response OmpR family regulator
MPIPEVVVRPGRGNMASRILLAQCGPPTERLAHALEAEGYAVSITRDGNAVVEYAITADLIVLDVDLAGVGGLEVTSRLRAEGHRVPILMLTARAEEIDIVAGLDAGADAYVTVPFRLAELLARLRALLRRGGARSQGVQGVRIDVAARQAYRGDALLALTGREFDLLRVLIRDAGKVVTREQLMLEVWHTEWLGSAKTIDMHMSWLRRKLGDEPANPRFITTIRGVGFRFELGEPAAPAQTGARRG